MIDYTGQQFGNHHLIRLLVHGSLTDVYLGEHVYLKKKAAVKILSMRLVGSNMENFLEEARTISNLKHPHILRMLDFGGRNTIPFLVMDYMSNGTLRQCYAPGSVLPITSIASYVKDIASALQYAHDEGIIHRDVKPENMFVGHDNSILLADFRMALTSQRLRYRAAQSTASAATYMAPEQISGNPCPASDQYALAAVVYEWMSGDPLFHGSFTEICDQQLHAPPPSLREKMPELSPAVEEVIQRALAKNADMRFSRVQEFANALEEAVLSELPTSPGEIENLPTIAIPPFPEPQTAPMPTLASPEEETDPSELPTLSVGIDTLPPFDIPPLPEPATAPMQALAASKPPDLLAFVPTKPPDDAQLSQAKANYRHHLSRRSVLVGLAGISIVGGTFTWLVTSQKTPNTPKTPVGTHLFTYRGHHAYIAAVAWSPDGKRIASGSGDTTVQVWTPATKGSVLTYHGHNDVLYTVAWSPDGKRIASGGADQTVQVWDAAEDNHPLTYNGHASTVYAVAWSPDSKEIVSASNDGTVQVWSSANGNTAFRYHGHSDAVWDAAWSPDGKRIASASFDRTVQVWNAIDGSHAFVYHGHNEEVHTAAWSPDGKRIASGGADQTVQVWDAATGDHVFTYRGHVDNVYYLAWSPDGTTIASASADSTVQVWDAATGGRIFTYRGHAGYVLTAAWSPDGQQIASGGTDMTVQGWQAL